MLMAGFHFGEIFSKKKKSLFVTAVFNLLESLGSHSDFLKVTSVRDKVYLI
jgi:hypothetical protein